MSQQYPAADQHPVLDSLEKSRRQDLLSVLSDRNSPIDTRELATNLAAKEQDKPLLDVTHDAVDELQAYLMHVHLPKLEAAGLVNWDQSTETVATTDHPALDDPKFQRMIDMDVPGWEAVVDSLASRRRRIILAALKDATTALTKAELAERVVTREHDTAADTELESTDSLEVSLHRTHLPELEQAGLIFYDSDTGTAVYTGHAALDDEWLDFRPTETSRAIVPSGSPSDDIWTIEGRDNVIARGQSLFEQADEELFLMVTTTGLLEEGCIRRLQAAVARGVDVYLGSQTQEVRDLVREEVPEATIWEPQMDWLNLPPESEKVGRLVLADREAIMLATLGREAGDGVHHKETAITGSAADNPLVMLVREMLGSRLDHLDAQSEDFLDQLPL